MDEFGARVLKLVAQPDYAPMTVKAVARRMQVGAGDYGTFRAAMKRLVKEGKLDLGKDKTLRRPDQSGIIVGLFRRSAKGFGFVRPQTAAPGLERIYIPIEATRDAATGDEVAVKVKKGAKGRGQLAEGRIARILSRASGLFVGTYFESGRAGFVLIDGSTFHDPILVGDPGAKGARPGDKVALEIVRYPTPYQGGEGVLSEILGPRGEPGVDTLAVIRAFNIPDTFEEPALEEARQQASRFDEALIGARIDLRDLPTVTIDPATARDFDDAISLQCDEKGHFSLGVHIADVSHFVPAGSVLDRTARSRGTSVYLADQVIPMLPEILSNSLASLQAGRVRYAVSVLLDFNPDGIQTAQRFLRSAIRVDRRFTYEEALAVMRRPEDPPPGIGTELAEVLEQALRLSRLLRRRRLARGGLELTLPEIELELSNSGAVTGAHLASHDESHQLIEEFMVAANEAVAAHLTALGVGFLRRAHPEPERRKLAEFGEFARSLGLSLDQPQNRFELQRILAETVGQPEEYAVHYGLLRSLKQANYTPEHEGHYALASDDYCHFTSPIRRYPDLQVHRQLVACIEGRKPRSRHDELAVLGEHCTRTERRAAAAERDLTRVKLLTFLHDQVGTEFHAIVVAVEDFGLACRLVELPVEGFIHVTSLADDYYYLESGTHTLVGRRSGRRHRLGDRVVVRIAHVDVDRRELDLVLLESPHPRTRPTPPRRPAASSRAPYPSHGRHHKSLAGGTGKGEVAAFSSANPPGERRKTKKKARSKSAKKRRN
jgi:ribonuclease R